MIWIYILFHILFYFEKNLAFGKYYYVKAGGKTDADCSEVDPCATLSEGLGKSSGYDTICVVPDSIEVDHSIEISKEIIKSSSEGTKVNIPVIKKEMTSSSGGYTNYLFCMRGNCIMKDFKLTIGSTEDETPTYNIFYIAVYTRLENVEFVRKDENNKKYLQKSIINGSSSSYFNLYLHSCTFTNIELIDCAPIEGVYPAFYNSSFSHITRMQGNGSVYEGIGDVDIIDCTFDTCKCLNGIGGGAVYFEADRYNIGGYKSNTTFKGCSVELKVSGRESNEYKRTKTRGGAIYVKMSEVTYYYFNVSYVEFGSGDAANKANVGANIFFSIEYLENNINSSYFPLLKNMDNTTDYYAYEFSSEEEEEFYPMSYLLDLNKMEGISEVYIGGDDDSKDCKSADNACSSYDKAKSLIRYGNLSINFVKDYELEPISVYEPSYFKGYDNNTRILVSKSSTLYIRGNSTIDKLNFYLPSYLNKHLLDCNGNYFVMKSVSFKLKEYVDSCEHGGSILYLMSMLEMIDCTFENIENNESIGAIYVGSYNFSIKNCTFDSCSSSKCGGALYIFQTHGFYSPFPFVLDISSCTFNKCKSLYGGAIYLGLDRMSKEFDPNIQLVFNDITFGSGIDKNFASYGQNIYFYSKYFYDLINTKNFPMLKGLDDNSSLDARIQLYSYSYDNYMSRDYYPIYNMLNFSRGDYFTKALYIGYNGTGNNTCKSKNDVCLSLKNALKTYYFNKYDIIVVNNFTLREYCEVYLDGHTFKGNSDGTEFLFLKYETIYYSTIGTLTLKNGKVKDLHFSYNYNDDVVNSVLELSDVELENVEFNQNSKEMMAKYVIKTSGYINLNKCSFYNIIVERGIFSSDSSVSLNLVNCNFSGIKSKESSGSCFGGSLSYSKINSTSFKYCSVSNDEDNSYNGGALYLSIGRNVYIGGKGTTEFSGCSAYKGGAIYIDVSKAYSFVLDRITFGESNYANKADYGKNIYASNTLLEAFADYDHFPILKDVKDDNNLYVVYLGKDEDDKEIHGSLIKFINREYTEGKSMYYVGYKGENEEDCGTKEKLCASISYVTEKVKNDIVNITVVVNLTISGYNYFSSFRYSIKGENSDVKIIPGTSSTIVVGSDCSLYSLIYEIDEESNNLFSVKYGTLNLSSSSFLPKSKVGFIRNSLISVYAGGNLIMQNCKISNMELLKENAAEGCGIYVCSSENCEVILRGVQFTNCRCLYGNGGGLYAMVGNGSTLIIEKNDSQVTSFKGCIANNNPFSYRIIWEESEGSSESGRGGGIYMFAASNPKELKVDCVFGEKDGEMNEAGQGYDIFVMAENMKKIMNLDNFPCLDGKGSGYKGAMGCDGSVKDPDKAFITNLAKYAKDNDGGLPLWAIILIIVLSVLVVVIIVVVVIIICCVCRGKKKKKIDPSDGNDKRNDSSDSNDKKNETTTEAVDSEK